MDDVVHYLLQEFPSRDILTIAGMRGNAAAGGVALAAACDIVIAGEHIVLNPAYRSLGLSGSEYHNLSYYGRCGTEMAVEVLRSMTPISSSYARSIGLVDHVLPGTGKVLEEQIHHQVGSILRTSKLICIPWKLRQDLSPASLAQTRASELDETSKDFYSVRAVRYHTRRFDFVRRVKPTQTPLRFATHRRVNSSDVDEEERDSFDDFEHFERMQQVKFLEQLVEKAPEVLVLEFFGQAIKRLQNTSPMTCSSTQTETEVLELPWYYGQTNDSIAPEAQD
jgi:hypothetical protein